MKRHITFLGLVLCCLILLPGTLANTYSQVFYPWLQIGDPISAANGAYHFDLPLLAPGGPTGLGFVLSHSYDRWSEPGLPHSFRHNCAPDLIWEDNGPGNPNTVYVDLPNGLYAVFNEFGNEWVLDTSCPVRFKLKRVATNDIDGFFYLMDPIKEFVYMFEVAQSFGSDLFYFRIRTIMDRNGNSQTFSYDATPGTDPMAPVLIQDGLGRSLTFVYSNQELQTVTDNAGRTVTFNYEDNAPDFNNERVLRSVTDARNKTTTFTFQYFAQADRRAPVIALQRPLGNTPFTQVPGWIDLAGTENIRVATQTDAYGNTTTLTYDTADNVITETRPDTNQYVYHHHSEYGTPIRVTDPMGNHIDFGQTTFEQLAFVTDRLGNSTVINYHNETGKIESFQNAELQWTEYIYEPKNQSFTNPDNGEVVEFTFYEPWQVNLPDLSLMAFSYDDFGNMTASLDRMGKWHGYTYNDKGQVLTIMNQLGGTRTYTYDTDGTMLSSTDSGVGTTYYYYDSALRLNRVEYPDGNDVHYTYNANDQVETATDERDNVTTFVYDDNGNLTHVYDDTGEYKEYTYDLMDRVVSVTDRKGNSASCTYDSMNRVETVTDRDGITSTTGYDARGFMDQWTRGGQTWSLGLDNGGVPGSGFTPQGFETSMTRNDLSDIISVISPVLAQISVLRDEMQRVTSFTDQLNQVTTFDLNNWGTLDSITRPVIGTATYGRTDLGKVTTITDLNNELWTLGHSNMGRLLTMEDPLSNQWSQTYDSRGRLHTTSYPDSTTFTRTRDAAGNVTSISNGSNTMDFTYHPDLNRLMTADGISFTYDEEANMTSCSAQGTTLSTTYNPGGRIETVTYDGFTVTYTYDPGTGALDEVTDDLTGTVVGFQYDSDMRLTGITRSNGVNTTYTLDDASRLTRIQHGSHADLQFTLDHAGQIESADMTVPLEPVGLMTPGLEESTFDAACQVSSTGYVYDDLGQRTDDPERSYIYDEWGRLVDIDGVVLSYNGLGEMVTRTDGPQTVIYHRNYAMGSQPVLSLQDGPSGPWLRHFVYTPGGRLLYTIEPGTPEAVLFYHFDQVGSTLCLTDDSGAVTDAYAYLPYGALLQHSGSSDQPFTFIGEWGVRQEDEAGELYHMRARYYDAVKCCFLSRDSIWPVLTMPTALNPYQYALLNPVQVIDPMGTTPQWVTSELNEMLSSGVIEGLSPGEIRLPESYYWNADTDDAWLVPNMRKLQSLVYYPPEQAWQCNPGDYINPDDFSPEINFNKMTGYMNNWGSRFFPDYNSPFQTEMTVQFEKALNDDLALSYSELNKIMSKKLRNRWMCDTNFTISDWNRSRYDNEELNMNNHDFFSDQMAAPATSGSGLADIFVDSRWQVKLTGMYQIPHGLNITGFFQPREAGAPLMRRRTYRLHSGTRLPACWMLNLGLEKTFKIDNDTGANLTVDWYGIFR